MQDCHGFFVAPANLKLLHHNLDRVDAAAFTHDDFSGITAHQFGAIRKQFGQVLFTTVMEPTGNDAGLNIEQLITDHGFIGRHGLAGHFANRVGETTEFVVFEAAIDIVHG